MKNKYVLLAKNNLQRRKKIVAINITIITISLFLLLLTSTIANATRVFLDDFLLNTLNSRTLYMGTYKYQEGIREKLEDIYNNDDRIIEFNEENYGLTAQMVNVDGLVPLDNYRGEETFGTIRLRRQVIANEDFLMSGSTIKENQRNVGIIPKKFLPIGFFDIGYWRRNDEFMDGESLIGEKITVEYHARDNNLNIIKTFEYTFEVIGVYDILPNQNEPSEVFVPFEDLQDIIKNLDEHNIGLAKGYNRTYAVVVDDSKNVNDVIAMLYQAGFNASPKTSYAPFKNISQSFITGMLTLSIAVLIIGFINISLTMAKSVNYRIGEIGLMKAIGYRDLQLIKIMGLEAIMIGFISFVISVFLYILVVFVGGMILQNNLSMYMQQLKLRLDIGQIIRNLIISIVFPLLSSAFVSKTLLDISPKAALDEGGER